MQTVRGEIACCVVHDEISKVLQFETMGVRGGPHTPSLWSVAHGRYLFAATGEQASNLPW